MLNKLHIKQQREEMYYLKKQYSKEVNIFVCFLVLGFIYNKEACTFTSMALVVAIYLYRCLNSALYTMSCQHVLKPCLSGSKQDNGVPSYLLHCTSGVGS